MTNILISKNNNPVCILGGWGNVGKYLIAELQKNGYENIHIFTRQNKSLKDINQNHRNFYFYYGNYVDKNDLSKFIVKDSIVINLLYSHNHDENLIFATILADVINEKKIKKLIHLSSSDVIGRSDEAIIDESSTLLPYTNYAKIKLEIENIFLRRIKTKEYVILRCNSVIGGGSVGFRKLLKQVLTKSKIQNYILSCIHNKRPLHLIHMVNVVSAILFFINYHNKNNVYYLSQDHEYQINYINLQYEIAKLKNIPLFSKKLVVDLRIFLKIGLFIFGKNSFPNSRLILGNSIEEDGFEYPVKFYDGLIDVVNELNDKT